MRNWQPVALLILAVTGAAMAGCVTHTAPSTPSTATSPLVSLPSPPPWPRPSNQRELVLAAGLDAGAIEMLDYHTHTQLDVFYDATPVEVPADIGIGMGFISPLHTHDSTGKLHVEAAKAMRISLGQFFTQWGVPLANAKVYDNGEPVTNAADLELVDRHRVVVVFGKSPAVIPSEPPNW